MIKNDKTIEKITALKIKNLGLDAPSGDFTSKIMQSIVLGPKPEFTSEQRNYGWLLLLIAVCVVIGCYFLVLLKLYGYVIQYWTSFLNVIQPLIVQFISIFAQFKNLSISPLLLIGFMVIISLLTIEELISRQNTSHHKNLLFKN